MAINNLFTDMSSLMTVVSFTTFIAILWWTFGIKRSTDFDTVANLPFADEINAAIAGATAPEMEKQHG